MSALGNPGKFSYCIAENEEENPWEPLHVEQGLARDQSAVTLFAAEAPHGISEHKARTARGVLKAISYALATVWSYRNCLGYEALVVLCPEHVQHHPSRRVQQAGRARFSVRKYRRPAALLRWRAGRRRGAARACTKRSAIDGEPCYQKFRAPESIKIVVAGGTAGNFRRCWEAGRPARAAARW